MPLLISEKKHSLIEFQVFSFKQWNIHIKQNREHVFFEDCETFILCGFVREIHLKNEILNHIKFQTNQGFFNYFIQGIKYSICILHQDGKINILNDNSCQFPFFIKFDRKKNPDIALTLSLLNTVSKIHPDLTFCKKLKQHSTKKKIAPENFFYSSGFIGVQNSNPFQNLEIVGNGIKKIEQKRKIGFKGGFNGIQNGLDNLKFHLKSNHEKANISFSGGLDSFCLAKQLGFENCNLWFYKDRETKNSDSNKIATIRKKLGLEIHEVNPINIENVQNFSTSIILNSHHYFWAPNTLINIKIAEDITKHSPRTRFMIDGFMGEQIFPDNSIKLKRIKHYVRRKAFPFSLFRRKKWMRYLYHSHSLFLSAYLYEQFNLIPIWPYIEMENLSIFYQQRWKGLFDKTNRMYMQKWFGVDGLGLNFEKTASFKVLFVTFGKWLKCAPTPVSTLNSLIDYGLLLLQKEIQQTLHNESGKTTPKHKE